MKWALLSSGVHMHYSSAMNGGLFWSTQIFCRSKLLEGYFRVVTEPASRNAPELVRSHAHVAEFWSALALHDSLTPSRS